MALLFGLQQNRFFVSSGQLIMTNYVYLIFQKATSVTEGLELLAGRDQIEGVKCSKENKEVKAWQQTSLEKLPAVLILHLKLFNYNPDGCAKIIKAVEFPVELKIDTSMTCLNSPRQREINHPFFFSQKSLVRKNIRRSKGHTDSLQSFTTREKLHRKVIT